MVSYYYIDRNTNAQYGPFPVEELKRKGITPNTLVWSNGMADWVEAGKVPELSNLFYNSGYSSTTPPQPGYSAGSGNGNVNIPEMRPMPKNWFVEAILLTLLCSPIFGIIAIIYANKVESRYYAGDYDGAVSSAKSAKMWVLIGLFGSLGLFVLIMLFYGVMAFSYL